MEWGTYNGMGSLTVGKTVLLATLTLTMFYKDNMKIKFPDSQVIFCVIILKL